MATKVGMPKEQMEIEGARLQVFWDRYKAQMEARGEPVSQTAFAQLHFDMTQGNFGHLLKGRQPIPLEMLFDLAILLDFDPREIRPELQQFIDKVFRAVRGAEQSMIVSYLSQLAPEGIDQVLSYARFLAAQRAAKDLETTTART